MLEITVGGTESFDDGSQKFVITGGRVLQLEHSLVSMSKWEATYEKPFLGKEEKTPEEVLTYVKCMLLDPKTPEEILHRLDETHFSAIQEYIEAKMTATWFAEQPGAPKTREVITAELIYYWMTVFNIPFSCETWHVNRLFTLIRICNIKAAKPQKMGRAETARRQQELNRQRRAQMGTKG
jgi:hypothetical protein